MTHLQYMPGDPRLVDQLVCELKSKGIFDQFRKDCISDVDTKPAYQNLRQRVESSVASFLSRQSWKADMNKNQLREKLRKHLLDGNYLEQGVERIVDQVVNPKVSSVFIPQVEDLVYNYLGIVRKKPEPEENEDTTATLLPKDLEAVSPGSVHSNDGKDDAQVPMDIDEPTLGTDDTEKNVSYTNTVDMCVFESDTSIDKSCIPLPDEILPENIPQPENSPPKIDLNKIELPKEPESIPIPKFDISEDTEKTEKDYFKPNATDDDDSSSDASLTRNMSPLTPIRNLNNENSCDAQQAFENDSDSKQEDKKEPCSFRFALDKSDEKSPGKTEKKDPEQANLAFQFSNQVNIKPFNTPLYDDSSNSNNLHIDYESDANSKTNVENKVPEAENSEDVKKEKKEERKSSHKSSHRSRDSQRHTSSRDKRSDSKYSTSRDSSRNDKSDKKSKSDSKSKSSHRERERSKDRSDKKDSRDSSKHRSSHKSSNSKDSKDSKSHKSSSQRSSSSKNDDKKSSQKDKTDKSSDRSKDSRSKDKKESRSSSHRSDKDRKSSSHKEKDSKSEDKSKKKDKKDTDDHYSLSGRGNTNRRSTDRDSNDGSSSSKGSHNPPSSKSSESKKETKGSTSKSDNTSYSGDSTSPSDKENIKTIENDTLNHFKPAVHVDNHLELPIAPAPRLPFVPDVTIKKPKFAANLEEAKRLMKMRRFLDEEQRRMNQEAALLLEFQANVRPSLSQVYSNIPGPELEFACISQEPVEDGKVDIPKGSDDENDEKEFMGFECSKVNVDVNDNCDVDKDIKHIQELRNETYEENKPFSQLVNEISEYSRASERIKNINNEKNNDRIHGSTEKLDEINKSDDSNESKELDDSTIESSDSRTNLFEVTIITEELSEAEDSNRDLQEIVNDAEETQEKLLYFAEHEKYDSEIERQKFEVFLNIYVSKSINKLYLINCESSTEKIFIEIAPNYEIVNYHKNGHLRLPKKEVVYEVDLKDEVVLPFEKDFDEADRSPLLSPVKSECSFELSSDYAAKLEEMVNKTSRQEVMEIILGSVMESPNKMPKIDYYEESTIFCDSLKRKIEPETIDKNIHVLTPNKIRKISESDQISSTTEETDRHMPNNKIQNTKSKYLGRARRVGLSRPKKTNLPNSPSSDKSVENYEQNSQHSPNGKLKAAQRTKIQRYSTTDLYKPKLHYLSRRNNIRP